MNQSELGSTESMNHRLPLQNQRLLNIVPAAANVHSDSANSLRIAQTETGLVG